MLVSVMMNPALNTGKKLLEPQTTKILKNVLDRKAPQTLQQDTAFYLINQKN
jgi:hypothetical protein